MQPRCELREIESRVVVGYTIIIIDGVECLSARIQTVVIITSLPEAVLGKYAAMGLHKLLSIVETD